MVGVTLTIMEYRRARKSRESWLYGTHKVDRQSVCFTVSRVRVKSYPILEGMSGLGSRLVQILVESSSLVLR